MKQQTRSTSRRARVLRALIVGMSLVAVPSMLTSVALKASGQSLLRNHSPSVPTGLYSARVGTVPAAHAGDYVCLLGSAPGAPPALRQAIADGLVPSLWKTEPLLKRVAAVAGDRVSYEAGLVHINGAAQPRSTARATDVAGRALPRPPYPQVLQPGTVWLSSSHERGFDSRYFGPVSVSSLSCVAKPLWID